MTLLAAVLFAVYMAERINALAAAHWREFVGQNYFDSRGVFISIMYCTPLLFAAFFILINALRTTSMLLVQVKRKELKARNKATKKAGGTLARQETKAKKKDL